MYPYSFSYKRAKTLAEAQSLFGASSDAKYLAGGHTLIPTMKQRLAQPSDLIDISRIAELKFIRVTDNMVVIGAGTVHNDVATSPEVRKTIPALADLAVQIGDPAVRHCGTIGGSVANNDPAADYPAAVLGLGATVKTTKRAIPADRYFTGMFSTALEDGEIITEIQFPVPQRAAYMKFRNPASGYAMAGAFVAKFAAGVRVGVTGVKPCVFRMTEAEQALSKSFSPDALTGITIGADGANSDIHASAEYRAHLGDVMIKRAVQKALG